MKRRDDRDTATALLAEVGDVVLCHDASLRESMKIPNTLGLVVEARKDRARVYFADVGGTEGLGGEPWIAVHALARVKGAATSESVPPWLQRAHFLVRSLDTQFLEVAHVGADGCALRVFHGECDVERIDAIRDALGDELRYWRLLPAGMHKMESAIAFLARARPDAPPPLPAADAPA
jgi:hypothetical protein